MSAPENEVMMMIDDISQNEIIVELFALLDEILKAIRGE
jgi:hypothetical protein